MLLDRDLGRIPAPAIRDARVLLTLVGGQAVYELSGTTGTTPAALP